jgi:uncharacterized protein (DUF4415 family)
MANYTLKQVKRMKSLTDWRKVKPEPPPADEDFSETDLARDRIQRLGKGFTAVKKYIAKRGRPKKEFPKEVINIAFERHDLLHLRALGRGWQTRLREYVEQGIAAGAL